MLSHLVARHPRKLAVLAAGAVLAVAGVGWMLHQGANFSDTMAKLKEFATWCAGLNPVMYVLAVAVLPYLFVPSSFLYPLGGNAYGFWFGLLWTTLGLALNLPLGYFIGTRVLRGPISRWLLKSGKNLPELPPGEMGKLVVLTRFIPGPPLIAQNYLLALAGVPFPKYFFYSLPICVLFATGMLLAGQGLLQGNVKVLIAGVCTIIALALLAHVANAVYKARKKNKLAIAPAAPEKK